MTKRILVMVAIITSLVVMADYTAADVPKLINFQGKLYDEAGTPLTGTYTLTFRMYTMETGGRHAWTETNTVLCENGLYTVILGKTSPLNLLFNTDYWLGISVSGDAEMAPRYRLTSSPYAFRAAVADSVVGGGSGPSQDNDWQVTGNNMYAIPSGNVGIGVLEPEFKLDVGDRIRVSKGSSNSAGMWFAHEGQNPENRAFVGLVSDTSVGFWGNTGAGWALAMNTSNGNVGVSTENPRYRLHVEGADTGDPIGFFKNNISGGDGIGIRGECTVMDGEGMGGYFLGGEVGVKAGVVATGSSSHYGLQAMAQGGSGTNYGVYGSATGSGTNWGGYFIGDGYFSGNVGIGTNTPLQKLHVKGNEIFSSGPQSGFKFRDRGEGQSDDWVLYSMENKARLWRQGVGDLLVVASGGNVGMGTPNPVNGKLDVQTSGAVGIYSQSLGTLGTGILAKGSFWGVRSEASGANGVGIYAKGGVNGYAADFAGNVRINSLSSGETVMELGEGLDYAEGFDVADVAGIEPGTVLCIDPENPGKLTASCQPYDRKVAGIVAGANGLGSGVRLGAGQHDLDVALAGRVYCNVDATEAEVLPGDLLTTAFTPGYAMKVSDYAQAHGAILGKAMQGLERGCKGQILVLVTLQ